MKQSPGIPLYALLIPWTYVVIAVLLGFLTPLVNYAFFPQLLSVLSRDVVIVILSSISSGMMALTAIVFSLALVFITFGSTSYSPRLPAAFGDRSMPHAIGVFSATFIYTLIVLRNVGVGSAGHISAFTIWIAFAWLLVSLAMLFRLVLRMLSMTVGTIMHLLGKSAAQAFTRTYPGPCVIAPASATELIQQTPVQIIAYRGLPRYIRAFDLPALVNLAAAYDVVIRIPCGIGDPVIEGDVLAQVYGAGSIPEERFHRTIRMGVERALAADTLYAMQLLVDISVRALSPAINDPMTAIMALDQIEAILRKAGNAQLDIGRVCDAGGKLRVMYATPTWDDYLALGIFEIQHYGADSVPVQRRLGALIDAVRANVPEDRRPALDQLAAQRLDIIQNAFDEPLYNNVAAQLDRKGLGRAWKR